MRFQRELGLLAFAVTLFAVSLMVAEMVDQANVQKPEEKPVVTAEVVEVVEVEEVACPLTVSTFYDVPLDIELQAHIINECGGYGIDPAIVFAMIERESSFRADAVGDNGKSFGLMQIQKKWHEDRMEKLCVTDLMNPYENVLVGIDYLAWQLDRYDGDMAKALVGYNQGHFKETVTGYAKGVLERSEEIKVVTGDVLLQR